MYLSELVCLAGKRVIDRSFEFTHLLKAADRQMMLFDVMPHRLNG